ncbi:MAG: glutathionylspermidine synthase family protein, partial [Actinomycetota bacterium]
HVAYTREEESGEDAANAAVLANTAVEAGYRAVLLPVEDVRFDTRSRSWVHATGDVDSPAVVGPIEEIFALHPWENLVDDGPGAFVLEDPTLMHHWYEPAWKMFCSNKLLLVALWRCFPGHENLLPAYADGPGDLAEWVRKPVFGREGDGIEISARNVQVRSADPHPSPLEVWQAYTPIRNFPGSDGAPNHPVVGSWVVGEDGAAGIGIRESDGPLTDYWCRFVPNIIDKEGTL